MLDGFPCFDLVFEGIDEIFLSKRFVFSLIDFFDEIFLLDHFAGDYFIVLGVDSKVCFGKTTHP